MDRRLICTVALALASLSLAACGHSNRWIEATPWTWSSQWRGAEPEHAQADLAVVPVAEPIRISQQRTIVAPSEPFVGEAEPTVVKVDRQAPKRRADGKRHKRPKR